MKRHPSLQELSRDHHHGLAVARALSPPPSGRSALPDAPEAAVDWLRERWQRELAPHFLLEERELVPLALCGSERLRSGAERVLEDHTAIRAQFASLDADNLASVRHALGQRLEAHIRFEDREWFPALEADLAPAELEALAWRLLPEPEAVVKAFQQEDDGVWVATLDCGHSQHVRHRPPFQEAPWLETEAGRALQLGTRRCCPLCRMPRRPACARCYKETPEYDAASVPKGLLRSHTLKAGSWAEIHVQAGYVQYVLEDEDDLSVSLRPGVVGIAAPTRPHHIAPSADARLFIRFLRCGEG